jgi:putative transposase
MANTYHQIYIQSVFPVKYRKSMIHQDWKSNLLAVMGNLINEAGCKTILVNGVEDHVHCFFAIQPSMTVSDVMKNVKAKSSKWVNEEGYLNHRFEWQPGFGCFSYGHSQVSRVYRYIKKQEEHHKKMGFREEYLRLLEHFEIPYDERYIFHPPK